MNKKEQITLIDASFMKLKGILESSNYESRYYAMCEAEEKEHRKHRPSSITVKYGITVKQAARLFYVRNVVRFLSKDQPETPDAKSCFYFKGTVFAGYALFCEADRVKLLDSFGPEEIETICALDYSELVA